MFTKENIKLVIFIAGLAGAIIMFQQVSTKAGDAVKKADKLTEISNQLTQIAKELQTPELWLKNYLINYGKDSVTAKIWSQERRNTPKNDAGIDIWGISFLDKRLLPKLGVKLKLNSKLDTLVIDTLWNFKKK